MIVFAFVALPCATYAITVEISALVPGCGDGIIVSGEQCDSANLGGSSCATLGFNTGSLGCTSACTFDTSQCSSASGSHGGGGYRPVPRPSIPSTNVVFSGTAYPGAVVTLLKDGQFAGTTAVLSDATFQIVLSGISEGGYMFGAYAFEALTGRSPLLSFPVYVTGGRTTKVSGIVITRPIKNIRDTTIIFPDLGAPTKTVTFRGDVNADMRVDLVDFSIVGYWFRRTLSPAFTKIEALWLSGDGKVDLVDFSIMAYHWSG